MKALLLAGGLVVLAAGCASYDGRGLVPGQSTVAQVEKLMGRPAERLEAPGGESILFFTRAPEGRDTYAARIAPDGRLLALEQRLTPENFARVLPGKSTRKDVRELLGPPWRIDPLRGPGEVWDYRVMVHMRKFDYFVEFGQDGVAQKGWLLHDPEYDAPDGGSYN